ncbi:hypothetical protein LWI28_006493 [Acer negundo]|uniref:Uncharacterized protein n=1 Tax=Acer negundo TaxID=4023 RepID=A0AAD5NYL4_ACENE|nr:hypothetical protein LWI28_006493 [Acer negundo]
MCHGFISTMEEFRVTMKSTRSSLLVLEDTIASPNFTLEKVNRLLDSVNRYVWYILILLIGFLGTLLVNFMKVFRRSEKKLKVILTYFPARPQKVTEIYNFTHG